MATLRASDALVTWNEIWRDDRLAYELQENGVKPTDVGLTRGGWVPARPLDHLMVKKLTPEDRALGVTANQNARPS